MKVSKLRILAWVAIVIVAVLGLVRGVHSQKICLSDSIFGNDLRWRRNEILCAHQGVNSFRIWNRTVELKGFAPCARPDLPNYKIKQRDKIVHAYPPWHTCFFYFYGWLPEILCMSLMALCFGFCTKYIVDEVFKISKRIPTYGGIVIGIILSLLTNPFVQCFMVLNYGILITALFLLLRKFINSDNQIYAGLCWALMMIKPQVGILFFWPLFWQKKYKTIIIAVFVCFCATCFTAFIVKENPITLILQIPEIGKPYDKSYIVVTFLKPIFGNYAALIWQLVFFVLASLFAYWTKSVNDFFVSVAPIVALVPYWTYSQQYDHIILIAWFICVIISAITMKSWRHYLIIVILFKLFTLSWRFISICKLFELKNLSWLYVLICQSFIIFSVIASIIYAWQIHKHKVPHTLLSERL